MVDEEAPRRPRRARREAGAGPPRDGPLDETPPEGGSAVGDEPESDEPDGDRPGGDEPGGDEPGGDEPGGDEPDQPDRGAGAGGRPVSAAVAARRAVQHVADFTGRSPECVISIDRADGGWQLGVEVVETRRIPDTQDVLAIYEVRVDRTGDLLSYKRTRRYSRGQLDGRCR